MTNNQKRLAEFSEEHKNGLAQLNQALTEGDFEAINKAEKLLEEIEGEYSAIKKAAVFEEFDAAEDPIMAAVCTREYNVIGHKAIKEKDVITSYEMVEKLKLVDLADFFKKRDGKLPTWALKTEKLGYLIADRIIVHVAKLTSQLFGIDYLKYYHRQ